MSSFEDTIDTILQEHGASWTPEDKAVAIQTGVAMAALYARQAAGEDVTEDMRFAEAALANIQSAGVVSGGQLISDVLLQTMSVFITKALLSG